MARYIQRPENALKRANEFIDVGKPARALDTLQEVFRNKKWTYTWSESVIEPIMFKYLDLCVELKKSHIAKEGLFQYRNMFQLVNVGSLENVIRGYLRMAEERTESAQQQSSQAVLGLDDIDDIDNLATPESILMSAVCGEDAQDRSDRTILLPWVKFLWESYCQCLELLRVNSHCEGLYHDIARMAFSFCLKYNRKMEFRKLSEKLRKHLEDICKVSTQSANVSISKPETQQLNLDTRLYQLDSAIQMELWQEAYKAIEDIHGLMAISKKTPVPKTMANYYQKLAMVFWKAGNQLFHAAALLKLFQLSREMKKTITQEELQRMASHVLVATLAIPLPSAHPEFDRFIETDKSPLEKAQRLAVLLGLQQPPTRISLLRDITRLNVVNLAAPQFQSLHKWLEVDFSPLKLCKNVQNVIDFINQDPNNPLIQYIEALQDVTLVRLVRQISQVYQSIEFIRFLELAMFANTYKLERILVDCVRHNDMQITIDHKKQCVHFGTDLSESQREDHPDGPTLQSMPSEQVRSQLVNMSVVLHRAIAAINPNRKKAEREKLRAQMVALYHENKVKDHQSILIRQKLIEDRKEYIERLNTEREEEEYRRQEEIQRQAKLAEQKRLELEMEERERKRAENELQQIKERNLKDKKQQISLMAGGQKLLKIIEEKGSADPEDIAKEEQIAMLRERKEMQSKLKSQEKRIDYYERAKRQEELPMIEKYLADKAVQDQVFWENQEKLRIENAITERANAVAQQERLQRIYPDRDVFLENLRVERKSHFVEKQRKFAILLEEERKKRMAQRISDRRKERREAWLAEKEEERNRKLEEIRLVKEEQDRLERERKAKEREAEMEKLRIQGEKQRAREEEVEKKMQEKRAAGNRDNRDDRDDNRGGNRDRMERGGDRDRSDKGDSAWRNAPAKDSSQQDSEWRNARERQATQAPAAAASEGAKDSVWRARINAPAKENIEPTPAAAASAGANDKWRRTERGQDEPIRRGPGPEEERRTGEDRPPMRRAEDREPMRRGAEERPPMRRGDDAPRRDDRAAERGADRGGDRGGFRRDDRDRPERGDRDREVRRSDEGGFRRNDDRREDRRGADERRGDRRPAGNDSSDWRKKEESKREGAGAGSGWRTTGGAAPKEEEKPKEQEKPKNEEEEWTSVRRR